MRKSLVFIFFLSILAACSSGSDDNNNSVRALSLPKAITVMDPVDMGSVNNENNQIAMLANIQAANFDSPGTDFSSDTTVSFVDEASLLQVKIPNLYLCIFDQLNYQAMVNKGAYNATVDYTVCWQEVFGYTIASDPSYVVTATVISERSSNTAPHKLTIWLPNLDSGHLLFDVTIHDSAGNEIPFGQFVVTAATVEVDSEGIEHSTGLGTYISGIHDNGKPYTKGVSNHIEDDTNDVHEAYAVTMDTEDAGAIHSYTSTLDTSNDTSTIEHNFTQFNPDFILDGVYDSTSQSIADQSCRSRQQFFRERFGYSLYHANDGTFRGNIVSAGERVQQKLYLFFDFNGVGGSFYGEHYNLNNDEALPDGATVSTLSYMDRYNYYTGTFTAHITPGNLTKETQGTLPLTDLQNKEFIYDGTHPQFSQLANSWVVTIDQNNDFQITHALLSTDGGTRPSATVDHDNDPDTPEVPVDATLTLGDGDTLYLSGYQDQYPSYSSYTYTHTAATAPQERLIDYRLHSEEAVQNNDLFTGGDSAITFYCYIDCPIGGVSQTDIDSMTSTDAASVLYYNYGSFDASPRTYTLHLDNLHFVLTDDDNGQAVDASQLSGSQYTSKLLPTPLAQPATLQNLDEASTHYRWETSPMSYSHRAVFTDENGQPLTFDSQTVSISYTFDAQDDVNNKDPLSNPYHGNTFALAYYQAGGLFGLPHNSDNDRYEVNLETGTLMSNEEGQYVVKPTYEFQQPMGVGLTQCNALDVTGLLSNPELELMTDADIQDISFGLSDKPETNQTASLAQ